MSWDPEYALTLKRYKEEFGRKTPLLIWPSALISRFIFAVLALSFLSVPAMVAGLQAGGLWSLLFPIGLVVLLCPLPIAFLLMPWGGRRDD